MVNQLVLIDQAAAYIELLIQAYDIYAEYAGVRPNDEIYCILNVSMCKNMVFVRTWMIINE